uniref:G-protein coupled receptors family 1 profile domain-containing protein n=1 Tax=Bos mutus grunniens TaxID=30521 RepID=A0A8B9YLW2_BOSMU
MVLVTSSLSFCGPVAIILFCYVKIAIKLCRTARDNPLTSRGGHHRRACLLTLVVLVAVAVCFLDKKINSTGVFLVHLSVSDLLFALTLPGKITYFLLDFNWPFGEGLCRLTAFIFFVNTYSGIYLMTCVSVDRYLAVVRAHQGPRLREPGRAQLICAAMWVLATLQTRAFKLCLQLTVCLMNLNCSIDPIVYFFASSRYRKWLRHFLKLKASPSSPSFPQGKASSETQSINQTGGSSPLEENEV